jgi:hypothetical protein
MDHYYKRAQCFCLFDKYLARTNKPSPRVPELHKRTRLSEAGIPTAPPLRGQLKIGLLNSSKKGHETRETPSYGSSGHNCGALH